MRLLLLLPLFAAAVTARPQTSAPSSSDWKPIETESQSHRLRTENQEKRTYKSDSTSALKESVQQLTNQLTKPNRTTDFIMDTRTPPKIRFQQKNMEKKKLQPIENSHPGVAVPVDVDSFYESSTQTQKRPIIYRNENKTPTPDSGISTWILLSGQSTTSKPVRKQPTIKTTTTPITAEPSVNKTTFMTEKPVKGTIKIKPLATRKLKATTPIPTTTTTTTVTTTTVVSTAAKLPTTEATKTTEKKQDYTRLMTKIKASVLNNAVKNKTVTTPTTVAPTTTSVVTSTTVAATLKTTVAAKQKTTVAAKQKTTENPIEGEEITETNNTISENIETNELQPEAKIGTLDLLEKSATTTKRPRRPGNNKRKKNNNNNKNRRRKPANGTASEKIDTAVGNSTKPVNKEKPIGTQLYNYLSREVMPTVGVGLVGLMVTAGLASYFLYPFGGLRRTFEGATDRKDYYYDEYAAGGMAEEELIGKVIAGMPEQTNYSPNSYRTHLARKDAYKNEINYNYRNADSYYPYPKNNEYHTVAAGSKIGYGRDVIAEHQKETGYTVDDGELEKNQFVVGNIPKEFEPITPDSVPEHGPRSLRIRRYAQNDAENEIIDFKYEVTKDNMKYPSATIQPYYRQKISASTGDTTLSEKSVTTESTEKSTTEPTVLQPEQPNFFNFLRNLLELKVRLGLDLLLRTTDSFSNYLRGVQGRVDHVLKEENSRAPPR